MGCNWSPPVFKGIILHAGLLLLASTLAHPPNLCMKLSLGTQTAKDARKPNLDSHGGIPLPKSVANTLPGNWQILQKHDHWALKKPEKCHVSKDWRECRTVCLFWSVDRQHGLVHTVISLINKLIKKHTLNTECQSFLFNDTCFFATEFNPTSTKWLSPPGSNSCSSREHGMRQNFCV